MRAVSLLVAGLLLATACSSDPSTSTAEGAGPGPAAEADSAVAAAQPLAPLATGDPLPAALLGVLGGDGLLDMADLGGPAIINFWATWCAFCVEEMPDFEAVHADLGDSVRFIGVDREDNVAQALQLAADTGVSYELVEDVDGAYFRAVKARGMPTTVFVSADGVIVYRHAGPLTEQALRDLIGEHLGVTG